jgi:hypothetical protein
MWYDGRSEEYIPKIRPRRREREAQEVRLRATHVEYSRRLLIPVMVTCQSMPLLLLPACYPLTTRLYLLF